MKDIRRAKVAVICAEMPKSAKNSEKEMLNRQTDGLSDTGLMLFSSSTNPVWLLHDHSEEYLHPEKHKLRITNWNCLVMDCLVVKGEGLYLDISVDLFLSVKIIKTLIEIDMEIAGVIDFLK